MPEKGATANSFFRAANYPVGACNNDIVLSVSDDGGASFTGTDTDVRELPTATSSLGQGACGASASSG